MNCTLKALGLALMAVFALSAVVASAASAQKLTSDGPVTLTGTETGAAGSNATTSFGLRTECPGSTYTGHKYNVTPHTFIPSGESTFTITPHYNQSNCIINPGLFKMTIDMNGCDYVWHLGAIVAAGTYAVTMDIVCPVGQEIVKTIFTNAADHTANKPMCKIDVKAQAGLAGAHATDTGNGHIDLTGTVAGIHVQQTNLGTHALLCPTKTEANGKFDLDLTIKGHNAAGGVTGISLS